MISASMAQSAVVQDLLQALQDDDMSDILLVGCDGVQIPANRFVLSARSDVLKKMLYGNFREASISTIPFDYEGVVLEAIVEFCYRNEIPKFRLYIHRNAQSARRLVQLFKAADYLHLSGLAKLVAQMSHNLTARYPSLACAVYDEADLDTAVSNDALLMIRYRPYVTLPPDLETGGGIDCLYETKLLNIFMDKEVKAGELFLFEMLQKWVEVHDHETGLRVAQDCVSHLNLEYIEPQDLLTSVRESGFCSEKSITDAITKQALQASQSMVWSLSSRGRPDVERILVEGAGSQDANGIYYRIDGLANGELYSKREVACGQQHVYTLSISVNSSGTSECRIFCSKLLTHCAVRLLARSRSTRDPSFQPLMQIIQIDDDMGEVGSSASSFQGQGPRPTTSKYTQLQLSDGDHFIYARIRTSAWCKDIVQNSLIKILNFETYIQDGCVAIHLKRLSIISQNPGHKFGNPAYYFDIFDEVDEDDGPSIISSGSPIEVEISQELMNCGGASPNMESVQALLELYSCRVAAGEKPIHSKIPSTGWTIDSHGCAPVPRTRWIPGPVAPKQPTTNKDITTSITTSSIGSGESSTISTNEENDARKANVLY